MDWAKHRRAQSCGQNPYADSTYTNLLPSFVIVDTAPSMNNKRRVSCAPISKAVKIALILTRLTWTLSILKDLDERESSGSPRQGQHGLRGSQKDASVQG